jgi:hypothetical protein
VKGACACLTIGSGHPEKSDLYRVEDRSGWLIGRLFDSNRLAGSPVI